MFKLKQWYGQSTRKQIWVALSIILIVALIFPMAYAVYVIVYQPKVQDPISPDEYYQTGLDHLDNENYQAAYEAFIFAVRGDPDKIQAHYELGKVYLLANQPALACAHLTFVLAHETEDSSIYYQRALAHLALWDLFVAYQPKYGETPNFEELQEPEIFVENEEIEQFEWYQAPIELGEILPFDQDAFAETNECNYGNEAITPVHRAFDDLDQAYGLDPQSTDVNLTLGYLLFSTRQFEPALSYLDQVIANEPDSMAAINMQAQANYAVQNYAKAIEGFNQIIEQDEASLELLFTRASAHFHLEDYERAILDWTRALELDPENVDVLANRALAYQRLDDGKNALQGYEALANLLPEAPMVQRLIGDLNFQANEFEKAIAAYSRAIELDNQNLTTFFNRGVVQMQLEAYRPAISDFEAVLDLDPGHAEAHKRLADAYYLIDWFQQAINEYQAAIALDDADPLLFYNLGKANQQLSRYEAARSAYADALQLQSNFVEAAIARASKMA